MSDRIQHAPQMALDWNKWLESLTPVQRDAMNAQVYEAPDPEAEKRTITNLAFLTERTGMPLREVKRHYADVRSGYAAQNGWGTAWEDDAKFHGKIVETANFEQARSVMYGGMKGDTPEALKTQEESMRHYAYNAGTEGKSIGDEFSKWQGQVSGRGQEAKRADPGYKAELAGEDLTEFSAAHEAGKADAAAGRTAAEGVFPVLQNLEAGKANAYDAAPFMRDLTPRQLRIMQREIGRMASKKGGGGEYAPEGELDKIGYAAGRSLFNIGSQIWEGKEVGTYQRLKFAAGDVVMKSWLEDGVESLVETAARQDYKMRKGQEPNELQTTLTAEQAAEANAILKRKQTDAGNLRKLRMIAQGTVLPVESDSFLSSAFQGVAESLPIMGLAWNPVGQTVLFASYTADAEARFLENGVPEDKARLLAPAAGIVQALVDRTQAQWLVKNPMLKQVMQKWGAKPGALLPGRILGTTWMEIGAEHVQDFTPKMVQDVGAAIFGDVTGTPNEEVLELIWESTQQMIPSMLMMSAVGSAHATWRDVKGLRAIAQANPESLARLGYTREHIAAITLSQDDAQTQAMLREFWPQRVVTPEMLGKSPAEAVDQLSLPEPAGNPAQTPTPQAPAADAESQQSPDSSGLGAGAATTPASEPLKVTTPAVETDTEDAAAPLRRDDNGWYVKNEDGTRTDVGTVEAGLRLQTQTRMAHSEAQANAMISIADTFAEREKAAGKSSEQEFTGEVKRIVEDVANTPARLNEQLRALGQEEGVIEGENWIAEDGTRMYQINPSVAPVLTQVHEFAEARARDIVAADGGVMATAAARAVAPLFHLDRGSAEDRQFAARVHKAASGQAPVNELIETVVELAVANELGKRKDGSRLPAGAITAGVDAAIQGAVDPAERAALGKFRSFLRAMKAYLRGVFAVAAKLRKGEREGADLSDFHTLVNKMLGIDGQVAHEGAVVKEVGAEAQAAREKSFSVGPFHPRPGVQHYRNKLAAWERGEDIGREEISMGGTPLALRAAGAGERGLMVAPGFFDKVTKEEHHVPIEALRALPESLSDPVAVFQSRDAAGAGAMMVLTEYMEDGKPVLAAIHLDRRGPNEMVVNRVASLYAKGWQNVADMFGERPLYVNKEKSRAWARTAGKQYPGVRIPQIRLEAQTATPEDVVKLAENQGREKGQSIGSVKTLEAIARQLEASRAANQKPKEKLAALSRMHNVAAGMARAARFNERDNTAAEELEARQEIEMGAARDAGWSKDRMAALEQRHKRESAALQAKGDAFDSKRSLVAFEAMLLQMPATLRGRVGGFAKLASFKTEAARRDYLIDRIGKMERLLEEHLKREYAAEITSLVEKSAPKREAGEKPKGKLGEEGHRLVDSVAAAMELTKAEADQRIDELVQKMEAETDPEKMADLAEELNIVSRFGALGNAEHSAKDLENSLEWLEKNIDRERSIWRIQEEARLAEQKRLVEAGVDSIGAADLADVTEAEGEKKRGMTSVRAATVSIPGAMRALFGKDSEVTKRWRRKLREAINGFLDDAAALEKSFNEMIRTHFGPGWKGRRKFYSMFETEKKSGVFIIPGGAEKTVTMPAETAQKILDGDAPALAKAYSKMDLEAMRAAVEDNNKRGAAEGDKTRPLKEISFTQETGGKGKELPLSQAKAVHLSLMWDQEQGRIPMEAHGFTEESAVQLEKFLTDEARAFRQWFSDHYKEEWGPLNEVFSRMQGVALPQIPNYSPLTFKAQGKLDTGGLDPFSGPMMDAGGMGMGMFKSRRDQHRAQPQAVDEFALFFRHMKQTSYFRHFGELLREMRNVLGNVDIQNAITTKHGRNGVELVEKVLLVLDKGGSIAKATTGDRWINEIAKARATASLSLNPGSIMKQAAAVMNLAYRLPAGEFSKRMWKLFRGKLDWRAMLKSPTIRRRLEAGSGPEMQVALSGLMGRSPTWMSEVAQKGLMPLQLSDAWWTAGSAAIALDYYKEQIKKENPKMPAEDVEKEAIAQLEETLGDVAQPISFLDKSIAELERGALARLIFMFQSEPRQKAALQLETGAEKDWGAFAKTMALNSLVGIAMQAVASMWRDARDDDDDELFDAENWDPKDFLIAAVLGQWGALPVLGVNVIEGIGQAVKGVNFDNSLSSDMEKAIGSVKAATRAMTAEDKEGDLKEKEPLEKVIHGAVGLMNSASVLIGKGEYGMAAREIGYAFDMLDTLVETQAEGETKIGKLRRKLAREEDPDERAALENRIEALKED